MTATESEVREFAREFDTPNVRRAIALAEAETVTWDQVHRIFKAAAAEGIAAVSR